MPKSSTIKTIKTKTYNPSNGTIKTTTTRTCMSRQTSKMPKK